MTDNERAAEGPTPICQGCNKPASELDEYKQAASEDDMDVNDYIRSEEGTYNPANGHFLCTPCYVEAGMPSSSHGWVCP